MACQPRRDQPSTGLGGDVRKSALEPRGRRDRNTKFDRPSTLLAIMFVVALQRSGGLLFG
jgi:hypothetical protein